MRVPVDYRTASKKAYISFCKKNPSIKIEFLQWRNIIYDFNEDFKTYVLETGKKGKLPCAIGDFAITKKKTKKVVLDPKGKEHVNLSIDWLKTKEKGKKIYNFNYHTEGYRFKWRWFKSSCRVKYVDLWWFKPSRVTSRLLAHYLKIDKKYQHLYQNWNLTK